jgi:hypothetical protein
MGVIIIAAPANTTQSLRGQEKPMDDGYFRAAEARLSRARKVWILIFVFVASHALVRAQVDPEKRQLIHLGYNQPLEGKGPLAIYGFYYRNQPNFLQNTNLTLRLAIAPLYIDSELGFVGLLGPNTDLAVGVSGGGYADSYFEVRRGEYLRSESFDGHGAEVSSSIYHRFNPDAQIPLNGVVKLAARAHFFQESDKTAANFRAPDNFQSLYLRTGLRYGGREPSMTAPLAMELSAWYEGHFRAGSGPYGFNGDRHIVSHTHLFWSRALLKYTIPESHQFFDVGLTMGIAANPDRMSAFRMGGYLPFISEFPLNIPGYYYQELTATRFALFNALYSFPIDPRKQWSMQAFGATGAVDYLNGLDQPGYWHSGVGGGVTYTSPRSSWFVSLFYGHGFDAIRNGERGADQVGITFQYDFEARKGIRRFQPSVNPYGSRGTERIFR